MAVSQGRVTGIRVVLAVAIVLLGAFSVIGNLFFGEAMLEANFPEGEPFTNAVNFLQVLVGGMALSWVVAGAIAMRRPLEDRGLLMALIGFMLILGLTFMYSLFVVREQASAGEWVSSILMLALGVALWVMYPRGKKA